MTFNYRGNPLVQQARHAIARGDIGKPHFLLGHYLQDWLLKDTDYSWRLEPDKGGASSALGDIGSHWCDLAQHVSGLRITDVLGDITTVIPKRKRPKGSREAFAAAGANEDFELVDIKVEDLASVLLRFDNGARGSFSVGQVCAGHKNDLVLEVCGAKASIRWRQEHQNELWIGHRDKANEILQKDPGLIDAEVRGYAHLPGGHQEAWADAFCNMMRDIYRFIAAGKKPSDAHPPAFATFEDGYRANCIVEAILDSATQGQRLDEGELLMATKPFEPQVHEGRRADRGAAGADAARGARSRSRSRDRGVARRSRRSSAPSYIQLSAALHPTETDVPPEAMLDPVANTLDLRQPFDKDRAQARRRRR